MKKLLAALLVLCLGFCLVGCVGKVTPEPPVQPDVTPEITEPDTHELEDFWDNLSGVWGCENSDGTASYVVFDTDKHGALRFSQGLFGHEAAVKGTPTAITTADSEHYVSVEFTDGSTADVYVSDRLINQGEIYVQDVTAKMAVKTYTYIAKTMAQVNPADIPGASKGISKEEAWELLNGIWLTYTDEGFFFLDFFESDGELAFATGVPFSGFFVMGNLTEFSELEKDGSWMLKLHFPEVPENEIDDGHAAFDEQLIMDVSSVVDSRISCKNIIGDGMVHQFVYVCEDLGGLDYDMLKAFME